VSAEVVLVLPEEGRLSRAPVDHEALNPTADVRREENPARAVAGIVAGIGD
jgi:hypothetical protein